MTLGGTVETRMTEWLGGPGLLHIEVGRPRLRVVESLRTGRLNVANLGNPCCEKGMHTRSSFNFNVIADSHQTEGEHE